MGIRLPPPYVLHPPQACFYLDRLNIIRDLEQYVKHISGVFYKDFLGTAVGVVSLNLACGRNMSDNDIAMKKLPT